MIHENIFCLVILTLFLSCSNYQKLLKSTDFDNKFESAVSYYDNSDYSRALPLFEDLLELLKEVVSLKMYIIIIYIVPFI